MSGQSQMSKSKLIETASEIIYRQGWNATGINQILNESKIPKGSFYYYFHSKDELGVAIIKHQAQKLHECYQRTLLNDALTGAAALTAFFEEQLELQRRTEWRFGCPIGSFSNEVAATIEIIANACRVALTEFVDALTIAITRGERDRTVLSDGNPASLAYAIAAAWQGSLLYMKSTRNDEPLQNLVSRLRTLYLKPTKATSP